MRIKKSMLTIVLCCTPHHLSLCSSALRHFGHLLRRQEGLAPRISSPSVICSVSVALLHKSKGKAVLRPTTAEAALRESHKNFLQVSFFNESDLDAFLFSFPSFSSPTFDFKYFLFLRLWLLLLRFVGKIVCLFVNIN